MTPDERIAELERRAGEFEGSVRRLDERISDQAEARVQAIDWLTEGVNADGRFMIRIVAGLALVSLVEAAAIVALWWRG